MEINMVEELVIKAKNGDKQAREEVINAFKPCIIKQVKSFWIPNYEFEDLINECNIVIVRLIEGYDKERKCFAKFCKVGIRNHLINLFTRNPDRDVQFNSYEDLILVSSEMEEMEENLCKSELKKDIHRLLGDLSNDEREVLTFLYLKGNTLSDFSKMKSIPYSQARCKRDTSINKFRRILLKNRISMSY